MSKSTFWSIGPIRGQYQPEDLTEKQTTETQDMMTVGGVSEFQFKHWAPREISVSFVVDNLAADPASGQDATDRDPEAVWAAIQKMQRPSDGGQPQLVVVTLPGWGEGENRPSKAVIVDASIKRTHIAGQKSAAVRATISVTLKEFVATSQFTLPGT